MTKRLSIKNLKQQLGYKLLLGVFFSFTFLIKPSAQFNINSINSGYWSDKNIWASDVFPTTQKITTYSNSNIVNGVGTSFLTLQPGDQLLDEFYNFIGTISTINSNNQLLLQESSAAITVTNALFAVGRVPTSNDNVVISDGTIVTLDLDASISNLEIYDASIGSPGELQINDRTLTVSGDYGWDNGGGTLTMTTGTLYIAGNFTNVGIFNCGTGTINLNGTVQSLNSGGSVFYNLITSGTGTKSLAYSPTVVNNDLTISSNTTLQQGANNLSVLNSNSNIYGTLLNTTGTATLKNVDLSNGTISSSSTGTVNITGTLTMPTGNGTIGRMNLNVTGTTTVNNNRTLTLNNNTGVKTFKGSVNINPGASWISTSINTTANLIFQNGIVQNGATFNAGGVTFSTNPQTISGTGTLVFGNPVSISGNITITSQTYVKFNNTLNGTVAGSTWFNDAGSTLEYNSATQPMNVNGTLKADGNNNTVIYNLNLAQTIKTSLGNNYWNLTLANAGIKTYSGATLNVLGNLTINNTAVFSPSAVNANIFVGGNWQDNNASGFAQGTSTVVFNGSGIQSLTSTTTETFYNLTVNKSSNTLDLNKRIDVNGNAYLQNGQVNTGFDINFNNTTQCGSGTINATAGMVTYAATANYIFAGTYNDLTVLTATPSFCGPLTVNGNLSPDLNPGTIGGSTSPICYNADEGTLPANPSGGVGGYTYLWYKDGISTGITTQTYHVGNLTANTNIYYKVTSCGKTKQSPTVTIIINPVATITSSATATWCNNIANTYTATSSVGTATFAWSRAAITGISNASNSGTGATITETLDNTTTEPVVVHYIIAPSVNGCAGTSLDVAVTVNPTAVVTSAASANWCNNVSNSYTATSSSSTATFAWTRAIVAGISNAANSGTGATITETLVNTTTEPVVVHYIITPSVNGCAGTPLDVAVTVNPTAVVTSAASANWCNNVSNSYTATSSSSTATFAWSRAFVAGISNAANSGTGAIITETLVNTTTEPVVVHYIITPSVNGCAGTPLDVAVTVNPTAVVTSAVSANWCNNVSNSYTATSSSSTATFAWSRATVAGISNAANSGTGATITETLVNTTTEPVVVHYIITPSVNGCAGTSLDVTVTVNPTAVVTSTASANWCNNVSYSYTATSSSSTAIFAWTRSTVAGISNAANSGTGATITETLVNTTTEPVVVHYIITPGVNGCIGTPTDVVVTVNPTAVVTSAASTNWCNNVSNSYTATSSSSTAAFAWSRASVAGISNAANSGTGATITETLVNTTTEPVVVHYIITPSVNGCAGTSLDVAVTVNPTAVITSAASANWCNNVSNSYTATSSSSTATFAWTRATVAGISNAANSGSGATITETLVNTTTNPVVVHYIITPTVNSCAGTPIDVSVTVSPTVQLDDPADQVVCNASNTAAVNFTTVNTGGITTYTWTNDNTSIGLAASGSGNIAAFAAVNTGSAPVTAHITVTPHFANGSVTCDGSTQSFSITVNPTAQVDQPANQVTCNGNNVSANFTTNNTGGVTTYTWTNDNTTIGLAASGNGNIPSFAAINNGNSPVVATVVVTAHFTNGSVTCDGTSTTKTFSITVNPTPKVVPGVLAQTICNKTNTSISLTSPSTFSSGSVTFDYTVTTSGSVTGFVTPTTGLHISDVIADNLNNSSDVPQTVTYHITPKSPIGGCAVGTTIDVVVTVNPTPKVVPSVLTQTICDKDITNITLGSPSTFTSGVISFDYTVTATGGVTGFTASVNNLPKGHVINDLLTNPTDAPQTVTYHITPKNTSTGCADGPVVDVVITVNPTPQVVPSTLAQTICNKTTTNITLGSPSTFTSGNITFKYTVVATGGVTGFTTPVSGLPKNYVIADLLDNPTNAPQTVTYTILPVSPTGCADGPSKVVVVTVNPTPQVAPSTLAQIICNKTATNVTLGSPSTFTSGNITFKYTVVATGGVTGFTTPVSGLPKDYVIADLLDNPTNAPQTVTYTILPVSPTGCADGPAKVVIITVNPTPQVVPSTLTQTICNKATPGVILGSPSTFTSGNITFKYTAVATGGVTGFTTPVSGLPKDYTIADVLNNPTNAPQTVTYTILPVSPTGCADGPAKVVVITIEPSAKIAVLVPDTLCNKETINFQLSTATSATGTVVYDLTTTPSGNVGDITGFSSSGNSITIANYTNTLINNSYVVQSVTYKFSPKIIYPGYSNYCYNGPDTSITIRVNPTPAITVNLSKGLSSAKDSICYNQGTNLLITTPNTSVIGKVKYDLSVTSSGSVTGIVANGRYGIANLAQNLVNTSDFIQTVTYTLTPLIDSAKNATPCFNGVPVTITIAIVPDIKYGFKSKTYTGGYNIRCFGEANGSAKVDALHGGLQAKGYKYSWNTGSVVDSIYNRTAGSYQVTVTDKLGCYTSKNVTLTQPNLLMANLDTLKNAACRGGNTGRIILTTQGGVSPYVYNWTKSGMAPAHTEDLVNLYSGVYSLTILDVNSCVYTNTYIVGQPKDITWFPDTQPYGSPPNIYDISCKGRADGHITPYFSTKIISYKWTLPDNTILTTKDITGLKAGNYKIEVTDSMGCSTTFTTSLTEPDSIKFSRSVSMYPNGYNIECEGNTNGRISITNVTGGFQNYQYLWSTVNGSGLQAGNPLQNTLTAGNYKLTVQDTYCSVQDSFTLTQPAKINVSYSLPSYNGYEIPCKDSAISLSLSVSGGFGTNFTYQWSASNGSILPPSKDQVSLKAGTYAITVTNGGVCTKNVSFTLNEPSPINVSAFTVSTSAFGNKNINCYNGTGYIVPQNITGGVPAYTFNWTTTNGRIADPASKNQNSLTAGAYQVKISDQNNCSFTKSFVLTQPDSIKISFDFISPTCQNDTNGQITAVVTGGVPNNVTPYYNYQWSVPGNTNIITGLKVGNYVVTVTDRNGCSNSDADSLKILASALNLISAVSQYNGTNISCFGGNDGNVSLKISGGSLPYTYNWNTTDGAGVVASSPVQSTLTAGSYSVTITDTKGCTKDTSFALIQPTPLNITLDSKTDVLCHGAKTGKIAVTGSGGIPPYNYQWSDGENTPILDKITGGIYKLTFSDVNHCILNEQFELYQPDAIDVTKDLIHPYCAGTEDGEIRLTIKGGVAPYYILWDTKETTVSLDHLKPNIYTYSGIDAHFCVFGDTINLFPLHQDCLDIPNAFSPNGDLINDTWIIYAGDPNNPHSVREMYPDARVEVFTRWGTLVYRSEAGYPNPWNGTFEGRPLPLDSYYYVIDPGTGGKPFKGTVTIVR